MPQLIHLLLCFLSTNVVLGQEREVNNVDTGNYLNYYRAVAVAEEAIVNNHYADAVLRYQKVFKDYAFNNPIDCYVASQVASFTGDTTSCVAFIYSGLSFGLPAQTITANPHLAKIFSRLKRGAIDSCLSLYQQRIDTHARATMLSLIKRDQSVVKSLAYGQSLYEKDGYTLKGCYEPVWDSLVKEVIALTRKNGFPAQKVIGTQYGEDSLFKIGPNAVFVVYIFIHHGNAWQYVGDILREELRKGNITPQMYGTIYESSNGQKTYNAGPVYFASRPCSDKRCRDFVKNNVDAVNKDRWAIGLCTYEVMQKKFESRAAYFTWCNRKTKDSKPYFDFQCDLSFQGL